MIFHPPQWYEQLPSTNSELLEWLRQEPPTGRELCSGFVLAARQQTAGRGRYQRRWIAGPGRDLTFSFLHRTHAEHLRLASLPMAAALGVVTALAAFGIGARTKWPNDVLVNGRKICGILAEQSDGGLEQELAVVVGLGINVNMSAEQAAALARPATSMFIETGAAHDVEDVLGQVLDALSGWIERWEAGGFAALRDDWEALCVGVGEPVAVGEGRGRRSGELLGFGPDGQLLLGCPDGTVSEIWSGDVSL